jgi:hypothetical protein
MSRLNVVSTNVAGLGTTDDINSGDRSVASSSLKALCAAQHVAFSAPYACHNKQRLVSPERLSR